MTVRQEANQLINDMPEEAVKLIVDLIHYMMPQAEDTLQNPSTRFGAGKGIITDSESFDQMDRDVSSLLFGETV